MKTLYLTLLGVAPLALASAMSRDEATILKRHNPTYKDCHADQEKAIKEALKDMETLASGAKTVDEKNKGWSHYFNAGDAAHVKKGFEAFKSSSTAYNFICSTDKDICTSGVFAAADPTPEDFVGGPHVKGIRTITIGPAFTTEPITKRTLDEKDYCTNKESKKLKDFETGGHTLLHEISHLDTFGLAAGYPEKTQPPKNGVPEFKYHGTIDWKGISTAGNAWVLKTSKAKNKPETWQNAESFAASATEIYAMKKCDIKEIDL